MTLARIALTASALAALAACGGPTCPAGQAPFEGRCVVVKEQQAEHIAAARELGL